MEKKVAKFKSEDLIPKSEVIKLLKSLKRYEMTSRDWECTGTEIEAKENDLGDYVKFKDIEKLLREL